MSMPQGYRRPCLDSLACAALTLALFCGCDGSQDSDGDDGGGLTDPPVLSVDFGGSASVSEGAAALPATVSLSRARSLNTMVTLSSSAPAELAAPVFATIAAGETDATFELIPTDDDLFDGSVTVTLTVAASGCTGATAQVTVTDDELGAIVLTVPESAAEDAGAMPGAGGITITPAPSSDTVLTLSASDTSEVTVLPTVLVIGTDGGGDGTASFDLTIQNDSLYNDSVDVTLMAIAASYESGSDIISVLDDELGYVVITTPASTRENDAVLLGQGSVSLVPAPALDLTVTLSSDDLSEATLPPTVVVSGTSGGGDGTATFDITPQNDTDCDGTIAVTIGASAPLYEWGSNIISVRDDDLGLQLASTVTEPTPLVGTVLMLSSPTTPVTVSLSSSNPARASVADSVVFVPGQTSAAITVTPADNSEYEGDFDIQISATAAGYETGLLTVSVIDDELGVIALTVPSLLSEGAGVQTGLGLVTISPAPASDLTVQLLSDDESEIVVPSSIVVIGTGSGGDGSQSFDVTVANDPDLDGTQLATVEALSWQYVSATGTVTVTDDDLGVTLATSATEGDAALSGTVTLLSAPPVDLVITLSSTDPTSAASVPPSATILAGATSAVFAVTITDDGDFDGPRDAVIAASAGGYETGSSLLTVYDDETAALTLTIPGSCSEDDAGVQTNAGMISVNDTPTFDLVVTLVSDDPDDIQVPETVTILPGTTQTLFDVAVIDDRLYDGLATVGVSATASQCSAASASSSVTDNELGIISLTVPDTAREGDGLLGGTIISIAPPPTFNVFLYIDSDDPSEIIVTPGSMIDNDGWATFSVTVQNDQDTDGDQVVLITATADYFQAATHVITVEDDE